MKYEPFVILNWYQAHVSQPGALRCPDPHWRCPLSSLAALNLPPPPLPPPLLVSGLECLKCYISPLSSDLPFRRKQARMLAASWPPVDEGRLNVTHIIIRYCGELGKDGGGYGELAWEEEGGGPGPDSFCPGQLKSLQPPPTTSGPVQHPASPPPWPEALDPPATVMDKKNQHTRLACSRCTRGVGLVGDEEAWNRRWRIGGY